MAGRVLRCRPAQVEAAAAMLARAFEADPMMRYELPLPVHRQLALPPLMSAGLRLALREGEVYLARGTSAAACWMGPDPPAAAVHAPPDGPAAETVGRVLGPEAVARLDEVTHEFARARAELVPGRHWYLALLGVDPPQQGKGLGSLLLSGLLASAGRDALPVYLETTNEANLAFYARHGFAVAAARATPGGLPYWALRREAQLPATRASSSGSGLG